MNNEHTNNYNINNELLKKAFIDQVNKEVSKYAEDNNENISSLQDDFAPGLTHEEKNHLLYLRQKALLDTFLEKGAISKAQYEKSLHDLTEKMGETCPPR